MVAGMRWALCVVLVACSTAGGGASGDAGLEPGPALDAPGGRETADCQLQQSLEGSYFRATRLLIQKPAGNEGALASTLTMIWEPQLLDGLLVLMFHVTRHDLATGELELEGGSGIRIEAGKDRGKFQFLSSPKPSPVRMKVVGCHASSVEDAEIRIYPEFCTDSIPIRALRMELDFAPDGSGIVDSWLGGGLCASDAGGIYSQLLPDPDSGCVNFRAFITDLGIETDVSDLPCGGDETVGWVFEGRFDAPRLTGAEFAPGLNPLVRSFRCPEG